MLQQKLAQKEEELREGRQREAQYKRELDKVMATVWQQPGGYSDQKREFDEEIHKMRSAHEHERERWQL